VKVSFDDMLYAVSAENFPSLPFSELEPSHEKSCAILSTMEQQELIEKIKRLPQDRVAEVEDFVNSLARREYSSNRLNLHQALADYAVRYAGTAADIDPDLEAAATDYLLQQTSEQ
jgi:hypothetical protein